MDDRWKDTHTDSQMDAQTDLIYITAESMKSALEKLEVIASEAEVCQMIQDAGLRYEKWIDFQEFCKILEPLPGELSSYSSSVDIDPYQT